MLHHLGFTHRDLKPANILIHNRVLKIGDFGMVNHRTIHESQHGTPLYMPPEYFIQGYSQFTNAVDVWAFGVILHEMVFGHRPFEARDKYELRA